MASPTRWWISICWMAITLSAFFAADASSLRSWLYLTTVSLVPPFVLMRMWHDRPSATIAEVLHGAETQL